MSGRCPKSFQVDSMRQNMGWDIMFKKNIIKDRVREVETGNTESILGP